MPDSVTRLAPAKLNLALHVTGRRDDGYHLIESLVAFADFGDRITVSEANTDELIVAGPFAAMVPIDESNLVVAARDLLREHHSAKEAPPVSTTLEKKLPVTSGIGGGSSDAAAALQALASFWEIGIGAEKLAELAQPLGADVPMCLAAVPLIARGIGDVIEPIIGFPALHAVLVNPGLPVSTPEVFQALETRDNAPLPCLPPIADPGALLEYLAGTRNDLQAAATELCPMIDDALASLQANNAAFARMSGSGATCFGLFENGGAAVAAADRIRKAQPGWFVEACRIRGTGDDSNGRN
jgi:4-diphosphocytidyl-2-C-methyl-D-erythritol kinase